MTLIFWVSVFLVIYTYIGYPLVLWVLTRVGGRDIQKNEIYPRLSVIVTARNEADKIRQKIDNTLTLDYPASLLEVIVASDASDDGTDDIVRSYATRGVRLVRSPYRGGKEFAQGLAVGVAKGEILVFTDVATVLEPDAIKRVVENFADPMVGAVSTEDLIVDASGVPTGEGVYVKYEMWVRRLESRFYSLVGLSGSCFAIRRELCADWSPLLASDFMAALRSVRKGYRSIVDPSVRGRFPTLPSPDLEMRRKIRTFLRGITVLMSNLNLSNPIRYGRFAFQLASHKLLRFVTPFFLLVALVTSGVLAGEQPFRTLFWAQAGFYALGVAAGWFPQVQRNRLVRLAWYFTMVQWSMLVAWVKYGLGQQQVTWEPSKRPAIAARDHGSAR